MTLTGQTQRDRFAQDDPIAGRLVINKHAY
jgi:hypothetical protein